ncbi:hypothetical protein, partial [Mesorhizobium sp. ORS 3428]|uniref:hypothetical protein n=1 Tax=Mesorhizobium sp. ORS 3428 TaxID=540997 RepID=UPI001AEC9D9D
MSYERRELAASPMETADAKRSRNSRRKWTPIGPRAKDFDWRLRNRGQFKHNMRNQKGRGPSNETEIGGFLAAPKLKHA